MYVKQAIVLTICFALGNALSCYQCIGEHSDCEDAPEVVCEEKKYNGMFPDDFPPLRPFIDLRGIIDDNNLMMACMNNYGNGVYRSCVRDTKINLESYCTVEEGVDDSVTCETCTSDLCNSGYIFVPSMFLLLVAMCALYL